MVQLFLGEMLAWRRKGNSPKACSPVGSLGAQMLLNFLVPGESIIQCRHCKGKAVSPLADFALGTVRTLSGNREGAAAHSVV